jgi:LmbE family N-acetylglucosaminyl deacetylase
LRPHATTPVAKGDLFARAASTPATPLHALVGDGPVLILAPHPDDDVLGCGGLIASCAGASIPVRITYLTDGRRSHLGSSHWPGARLAATRRDEAANAAQALGLGPESLQFLAFADTTLLFDRAAQRRAASALAQLAGQHPFSSIFAPWVHDPHPDHVAVALLARRLAAASGARLLSYPIWGRFLPDRLALRDRPWRAVRLDVRDRLAAKRAAIAAHRSQMTPLIDDAVVTLRPAASVQDAFLSGDEVFFE